MKFFTRCKRFHNPDTHSLTSQTEGVRLLNETTTRYKSTSHHFMVDSIDTSGKLPTIPKTIQVNVDLTISSPGSALTSMGQLSSAIKIFFLPCARGKVPGENRWISPNYIINMPVGSACCGHVFIIAAGTGIHMVYRARLQVDIDAVAFHNAKTLTKFCVRVSKDV